MCCFARSAMLNADSWSRRAQSHLRNLAAKISPRQTPGGLSIRMGVGLHPLQMLDREQTSSFSAGGSEKTSGAFKAPQWAVDLMTSERVTESNVGHNSARRARFKAPKVGVSAVGGRDVLHPAFGAVRAPSTQSVELIPSRPEGVLLCRSHHIKSKRYNKD